MMWLRASCLVLVVFCFSSIGAQSTSCTTPNNERAHCISIYECSVLLNAVSSRDYNQINFLRESQCGYEYDPLVCCGSDNNYRNRGSSSSTPSRRRNSTSSRPTSNRRPTTGNNNRNPSRGSSQLPDRSKCGFQVTDRILDGQVTGLTEFPWMALIQYEKKAGGLTFACGGSLISDRWILTAAHCVTGQILNKVGTPVNVRLGEWNTDTEEDCVSQLGFEICNEKPTDVEIEKTIPHEDYSDTNINRYHDIALIKLAKPVTTTGDFIKPICLPERSDRADVGDRLIVAGWGRTENANSSPVKLKLRVPIAEPSQCSSKFRAAGVEVGATQLCAGGERGKDSCNGDSGGPLMNKIGKEDQYYIEGIVSFGSRCGTENWPGIYTRVSKYIDWINTNIRS